MRRAAAGCLAALAVFAFAAPAQAALKLCNRTSYILYAATSAVTSPGSTTRGWTRIAPGDCQIALAEKLTAKNYLVYGRSALAYSGPQRAWGGNFPICVKDGDFIFAEKVTTPYCTTGAMYAVPFAAMDTKGQPDWTMTFDDEPLMPTLEAAQLAGVKRLLKDNGYRIAAIDTKPDKATGAALKDFRKKMNFPDRAGNPELFAALESEAIKRGAAPQGYTVCNDDKTDTITAMAEGSGNDAVSSGWWRIGAGACARLLTTPLKADAIWLLAQKPGGPVLVQGPDQFCVGTQEFEARGKSNCAEHGLSQAGFARIPVRGKSGAITHIGAAGLAQTEMLK